MTVEEFKEKLAMFIDATPEEQGGIVEELVGAFSEISEKYEDTRRAYVKAFMAKDEPDQKPEDETEDDPSDNYPSMDEAVKKYMGD